MRKKSLVILTLALTMVICLLFHMTAQAQDRREIQLAKEYYDDLEDLYVEILRDKLSSLGYENAGITLTKVYLENGTREYTSLIHHRRIDKLSVSEQEELMSELSVAILQDDNCKFKQEFFYYDK